MSSVHCNATNVSVVSVLIVNKIIIVLLVKINKIRDAM